MVFCVKFRRKNAYHVEWVHKNYFKYHSPSIHALAQNRLFNSWGGNKKLRIIGGALNDWFTLFVLRY